MNFGTRPTSDNIDRVTSASCMIKNMGGGRSWNRGAISHRSKVISTSESSRHFEFHFGNQPASGNIGSVMNVSGMVAKCCGSRWNRITRSLRSIVRPIFTSGFGAAIFKFGSRPTSDNVEEYQSVISKSDLAKIVGATDSTVEIASLSHVQWRI